VRINSKRLKEDFSSYIQEFENSTRASFAFWKTGEKSNPEALFKTVYPIFVLLESLYDDGYLVDPSQRIILEEALRRDDKKAILGGLRRLQASNPKKNALLIAGIKKRIFTPYYHELYSDAMLLLNQYYSNNYRGCYLAVRCILEDFYRHVYYLDHKSEFELANSVASEHALGINVQKLREYLSIVPTLCELKNIGEDFSILADTNKENDAPRAHLHALNNELYKEACAHVHASKSSYMNHFAKNSELVYDPEKSEKLLDFVKRVMNLIMLSLILVHYEQFGKLNDFEKSCVLDGFPPEKKPGLRRFLKL